MSDTKDVRAEDWRAPSMALGRRIEGIRASIASPFPPGRGGGRAGRQEPDPGPPVIFILPSNSRDLPAGPQPRAERSQLHVMDEKGCGWLDTEGRPCALDHTAYFALAEEAEGFEEHLFSWETGVCTFVDEETGEQCREDHRAELAVQDSGIEPLAGESVAVEGADDKGDSK